MPKIDTPRDISRKLVRAETDGIYFNAGADLTKKFSSVFGIEFDDSAAAANGNQASISTLQNFGISGFGSEIGVRQNFDTVKFSIYPGDATALPTHARVLIRETNNAGTILANVILPLKYVAAKQLLSVTAELGTLIANAGGAEMYLQVITDGIIGYAGADSNPSAQVLAYTTTRALSATTTPQLVVSDYPEIYCKTFLTGSRKAFANELYGGYSYTTTTFSGWGNTITAIPEQFNVLQMWIHAFDPDVLPTKIRVRFREDTYDGAVIATAVANVAFNDAGLQLVTWFFDDDVDLDAYDTVWFEYLADGFVSFSYTTVLGATTERYTSGPSGIDAEVNQPVSGAQGLEPWFRTILQDRGASATFDAGQLGRAIQQQSESIAVLPTLELAIPPIVYGVDGIETNIYWDGVFGSWLRPEQFDIQVACARGQHLAHRWRIVPSTSGYGAASDTDIGDSSLRVSAYYDGSLVAEKTVTFRAKPLTVGNGVTRKVLVIGDSLTEANTMTATLLADVAANGSSTYDVTLLGTQGSGDNKHEGYGGKSYNWHYSDVSSPFVFSGAFNFATYLSTNSYSMSSGDSVFFILGTNDFFHADTDAEANVAIGTAATALTAMITSIQAAVSGIKIWIGLVIPPPNEQNGPGIALIPNSLYSRDRFNRNLTLWRKYLLETYSATANIHLCQINCNLDTRNNFPTVTEAVNARNTATHTLQNNDVHPSTDGYEQMGDTLYCCLMGLES